MQTLDVGETVTTGTTWWDDDQQPVEPTTITVTYTKPDGSTVVQDKNDLTGSESGAAAGVLDQWTGTLAVDQAGVWQIDVVGLIGTEQVEKPVTLFLVGEGGGAPCDPWCTWDDVEACGAIAWPNGVQPSAQQKELWLNQGTEILYDLTDRRYPGLCTVTRSLCNACQSCFPGGASYGLGFAGGACSCAPYPGIDLGGRYPVWAVTEVVLGGDVLPRSDYIVRGRRWLVRTNGQWWPTGYPTADPDRFRVTWVTGRSTTVGGRAAAARYVQEIAKRCAGDASCALPSRVTNIVREGVSYVVLDPMTAIVEGRTSIDTVDAWITADNIGSTSRPGAFHPALHGNRRI